MNTITDHLRQARLQLALGTFLAISRMLGGGKSPYLFTPQHASVKLSHNADVTDEYEQIVCYLLPHRLGKLAWERLGLSSARMHWRNLCKSSTRGCRAACLNAAGRLGMADIAKLARTALMATYDPANEHNGFWLVVDDEIRRNKARVTRKGKRLVVRLNGTSDVDIPQWIVDKHADVIFSDYTKHADVPHGWVSPNRYVVFSATESTPIDDIQRRLDAGQNVVIPFALNRTDDMLTQYHGMPVIDGDKHDLRFLDPTGVIVGLRYKPVPGQPENHGFIRPVPVSLG